MILGSGDDFPVKESDGQVDATVAGSNEAEPAKGDGVETPFECPPPRYEQSHHVDTGYYPYKQV